MAITHNGLVPLYKPLGMTPLEAIIALKTQSPEFANQKISYAGRLDPMAEGILLLLVGDANKKRKEYEDLGKVYVSDMVFGIETDSYDALGLVLGENINKIPEGKEIDKALLKFQGEILQAYPPYSSKPVNGSPLYWWARQGKLDHIIIPSKMVAIQRIKKISVQTIRIDDLVKKIVERIAKVHGDFRQDEIIKKWKKFEKMNRNESVYVYRIEVACSSGTYIRGLAHQIGESLSTGAFALSIERTQIGPYTRKCCIELG